MALRSRAQAEKQGCYVAMETEGSSLPHSRNRGDWGVGGREQDVSLAAPRVGARRMVTPPPFFSLWRPQPAGGSRGAESAGIGQEEKR